MAEPDFAAEGLLEGLEGSDRDARRELLEHLHGSGVAIDELRRAVAEDRLALLPVELVMSEEGRYTPVEVADRAGIGFERLAAYRQALGLPRPDPDARVFGDRDIESAERARRFRDAGFPDEAATEVLRVIGEGTARVAEAVRSMFATMARPGDTERDLGLRYAELARVGAPDLGRTLEYAVQEHLLAQTRTDVISRAEVSEGRVLPGARDVAVAFADLVGFTRLGAGIPADELGAVASRLAAIAGERAEPPVRLVKTIGDAAMLVSPEAPALLDAILAMVEAADAEGEDFPQLRAGVAMGPALNRAGDWYGHTVNLASRVTGVARPGSVLATSEVNDALADAYRWSFAGERRLKGIKEPLKLFRARHRAPEDEGPEPQRER